MVWITLESGNIIFSPPVRRRLLDKAVENFRTANRAFPDNRIVRMYLGEPLPARKQYEPVQSLPGWAKLQRENLELLADIIEWWIDHRRQPDGQYGAGCGDDCEMWRWWVPVPIAFDDRKISAAQAKFSEALLSQPHMRGGYSAILSDVAHSAENSADTITPMMLLEPDKPERSRRARRLAELMATLWTGRNRRGQLQFKNTFIAVDRIEERPERSCDTVDHPRAVQPAFLLWQRTGAKRLGHLFADWLSSWVDAATRTERNKPAGVVPSAIHWPDGTVGGVGPDWWDQRNTGEPTLYRWPSALKIMNGTLLLAWHMTGDEKCLEPLRAMAQLRLRWLKGRLRDRVQPGNAVWCAQRLGMLVRTLADYKLLAGSGEFDKLLARDYGGLGVDRWAADRRKLTELLERSAAAVRLNFPGYSSQVRWADRVLRFPVLFRRGYLFEKIVEGFPGPNTQLTYATVTGDPCEPGYLPLAAVRWLTLPRQIAALVTATGRDRFRAELAQFGIEPRRTAAELYLLEPADYALTRRRDSCVTLDGVVIGSAESTGACLHCGRFDHSRQSAYAGNCVQACPKSQ